MDRQLAIVLDLNKCMGCQTCTVSCKLLWGDRRGMENVWLMKVNTMPGRGYPRDWEKMGGGYDAEGNLAEGRRPTNEEYGGDWELKPPWEVFTSGGKGNTVHLSAGNPTWGPNWDEDLGAGTFPNSYFFYMPRMCNQCSRPSCAEACPLGAISKRAEDGIVAIDQATCTRCPEPVCINACPYKEITWDPVRKVAHKCDFCILRLEQQVAPACVRQCTGRMVWIDYVGNSDGIVGKLVNKWKVALPLHAEWGTLPNVYYIPPWSPPRLQWDGTAVEMEEGNQPRIPLEYLCSLFGPGVDEALATLTRERQKQRNGERSELMRLLISPQSTVFLGPFLKDPSEVQVKHG